MLLLHHQIEDRFERQMVAMGTLPHPNLSRLLGVCPEEHCLVYEYADQGNLEQRLAQEDLDLPPLTWKDRFSIAYGESTCFIGLLPLLLVVLLLFFLACRVPAGISSTPNLQDC